MKVYLHGGKINGLLNPALALIQFGTDSLYFHVDCEYIDNTVIGALFWPGVKVRTLGELKKELGKDRFIDVYECLEPINEKYYFEFLKCRIGEPYDRLGLVYLAYLKLNREHAAANKWQKDRDYFCSELAADAFRIGGAKLQDIPLSGTASPADIARSKSFKFLERTQG